MYTRTTEFLIFATALVVGCGGQLDSSKPQLDRTTAFEGGSQPDPAPGQQPGTIVTNSTKRRLRITFMVDTSQSMAVVDPPASPSARERAVTEVIQALSARYQGQLLPRFHEQVRYGFIAFNDEQPTVNGGLTWGFLDDLKTIGSSMSFFTQTRGTANHQGALETCQKLIEHDLNDPANTEETLARTTHDIVLVTDGAPGVVCQKGCDFEDGEHPLCDKPYDAQCDPQTCLSTGCIESCYPFIPPCSAYNTAQSLQALASSITALSAKARIRLHVVLMAHHLPEVAREQARSLWAGVAAAGNGVYIESHDLSKLSFVDPLGLNAAAAGEPISTLELQCKNAEDFLLLDTEQQLAEVSDAAKTAVLACLALDPDPSIVEACANSKTSSDTGLSKGCASCYVEAVICTLGECMPSCLELDSPECDTCRQAKCDEAFNRCSGLTTPPL